VIPPCHEIALQKPQLRNTMKCYSFAGIGLSPVKQFVAFRQIWLPDIGDQAKSVPMEGCQNRKTRRIVLTKGGEVRTMRMLEYLRGTQQINGSLGWVPISTRINGKMLGDETTSNVLHGSDTVVLNFTLGDCVVCAFGEMKGQKGVLVANRADGRVLIRVAQGTYLEVPRICIQKANP
jgi:hypothetical protein